ncbi:hypothetical protein VUR80DRAFT_3101 [Thermomyces stellatus]
MARPVKVRARGFPAASIDRPDDAARAPSISAAQTNLPSAWGKPSPTDLQRDPGAPSAQNRRFQLYTRLDTYISLPRHRTSATAIFLTRVYYFFSATRARDSSIKTNSWGYHRTCSHGLHAFDLFEPISVANKPGNSSRPLVPLGCSTIFPPRPWAIRPPQRLSPHLSSVHVVLPHNPLCVRDVCLRQGKRNITSLNARRLHLEFTAFVGVAQRRP